MRHHDVLAVSGTLTLDISSNLYFSSGCDVFLHSSISLSTNISLHVALLQPVGRLQPSMLYVVCKSRGQMQAAGCSQLQVAIYCMSPFRCKLPPTACRQLLQIAVGCKWPHDAGCSSLQVAVGCMLPSQPPSSPETRRPACNLRCCSHCLCGASCHMFLQAASSLQSASRLR